MTKPKRSPTIETHLIRSGARISSHYGFELLAMVATALHRPSAMAANTTQGNRTTGVGSSTFSPGGRTILQHDSLPQSCQMPLLPTNSRPSMFKFDNKNDAPLECPSAFLRVCGWPALCSDKSRTQES
jgi:hypothetical protein